MYKGVARSLLYVKDCASLIHQDNVKQDFFSLVEDSCAAFTLDEIYEKLFGWERAQEVRLSRDPVIRLFRIPNGSTNDRLALHRGDLSSL